MALAAGSCYSSRELGQPADAQDPYLMGAKTFENARIGCHKRVTNDRVRSWRDASDGAVLSLQTDTFRQRPPSLAYPWNESGGIPAWRARTLAGHLQRRHRLSNGRFGWAGSRRLEASQRSAIRGLPGLSRQVASETVAVLRRISARRRGGRPESGTVGSLAARSAAKKIREQAEKTQTQRGSI